MLDFAKWEAQLATLSSIYQSAGPFPFIVMDDFLSDGALREALQEFPSADAPHWTYYFHFNERKLGRSGREFIPSALLRIIDELNSERFVRFLTHLTGVSSLIPDPSLEGGGLQLISQGGFLNIHADFTAHPRERHWARRVNLLIYLSEGWKESYGGALELWDSTATQCVTQIPPLLNRCVIFSSDATSFHGHPDPLTCPRDWSRKSIALYYFVHADRPRTRATDYRARPTDAPSKKALIYLDKMVLRAYDFSKRRMRLRNEWVGKLLRLLSR